MVLIFIVQEIGIGGLVIIVALFALAIWAPHAHPKDRKRKRPIENPAIASSGRPAKRPTAMSLAGTDSELMSIQSTLANLSPQIMARSGSLFYSGRAAFAAPSDLYILGLNPGGSPITQADETVGRDLADWQTLPERWSAYLDESWQGKASGTCGMQPRMRHMFDQLNRDLREVPASNVVFVRSTTEATLSAEKRDLLRQCWPIHDAVIRELGVRTILCLGTTAGNWVREAIGADRSIGQFRETNARGWTSEAHIAADGRAVVTVTHPGRADWRNPAADPTRLVRSVLTR